MDIWQSILYVPFYFCSFILLVCICCAFWHCAFYNNKIYLDSLTFNALEAAI